jgi:hypothetical protein
MCEYLWGVCSNELPNANLAPIGVEILVEIVTDSGSRSERKTNGVLLKQKKNASKVEAFFKVNFYN